MTNTAFNAIKSQYIEDEGHRDEDGKKQINHHAHLEFVTLDKNTGINRQRELTPQKLRELQSEVAENFGECSAA